MQSLLECDEPEPVHFSFNVFSDPPYEPIKPNPPPKPFLEEDIYLEESKFCKEYTNFVAEVERRIRSLAKAKTPSAVRYINNNHGGRITSVKSGRSILKIIVMNLYEYPQVYVPGGLGGRLREGICELEDDFEEGFVNQLISMNDHCLNIMTLNFFPHNMQWW